MPVNTTDTAVLTRVLNDPNAQPSSFLLDTFFTGVQTEETEEIHFDLDNEKPRLTPFVHPTRAGVVVENEGYETKSFKPAYAKDKRPLRPNEALKRMAGEPLTGNMTPAARRDALINQTLERQRRALTRREEVMASEALRLGQVTVKGEGYPTVVVDFQRDASLTKQLLTTARWGEAGVKPLDDLETWAAEIQGLSGAVATTVVMEADALKLFRADADVKELLDTRRGSASAAELGPIALGPGGRRARRIGMLGDFEIWAYQDAYIDDDGNDAKMLPQYQVIMAATDGEDGTGGLEGTRCYGNILDEEADFRAERFFAKSWLEKDPAVRWMLAQSAPLVVPYRRNASAGILVR